MSTKEKYGVSWTASCLTKCQNLARTITQPMELEIESDNCKTKRAEKHTGRYLAPLVCADGLYGAIDVRR